MMLNTLERGSSDWQVWQCVTTGFQSRFVSGLLLLRSVPILKPYLLHFLRADWGGTSVLGKLNSADETVVWRFAGFAQPSFMQTVRPRELPMDTQDLRTGGTRGSQFRKHGDASPSACAQIPARSETGPSHHRCEVLRRLPFGRWHAPRLSLAPFSSLVPPAWSLAYSVSVYIVTLANDIATPYAASSGSAIPNSSSVVFRVVLGHMLSYTLIMYTSTLISGLAVFVLWRFAHTFGVIFAFAVAHGGLVSLLRPPSFSGVVQTAHPVPHTDGGLLLDRAGPGAPVRTTKRSRRASFREGELSCPWHIHHPRPVDDQ